MGLSNEFIFRLIGAVTGAFGLGFLGPPAAELVGAADPLPYTAVLGLLGFLGGLILTPYVTIRPLRRARQSLTSMPPERLVAIITGVFLGLAAAVLISFPLSFLPEPFKQIMPLAAAVLFCYFGVLILSLRQNDLRSFLGNLRSGFSSTNNPRKVEENVILLDTSVIIDGRVADVCKTGFIRATLLAPRFVLQELQHIADSPDPLRRNRGRRGLDVLNILQKESPIPIRITDMDASEARDADSKLVILARNLHCPIMTNDYNLNKVAELQGVTVLNVNDLANAVKASFLPGEEMTVKIIQEGREAGQGIGYLEDGTMVVVEDGRHYLNATVHVTVTKVLQTAAGRMVFARP
ncbi:MAG: TRAM domain-containing protein [Chloroflexota bacterium]